MGTRAAVHWHQLLGPYDRFGWHHPGPAYFYLQSLPFRSLASGQSQFFGSAAINAAAGLLSVAAVWRRVGYRAALWTAICVTFFAIALGPALLRDLRNPYVVVLPMCLFAVMCAMSVMGSGLYLLGAVLVGSYLVQTDIGTVPVVGVIVVLSLVARLVAWRTGAAPFNPWPRGRGWVLAPAGVGGALLVSIWIPPVLEQLRGNPGNLTLLWRFFTASHPHHSLGAALGAMGAIDSKLAFRSVDDFSALQGSHYVALLVSAALAIAAITVASWRRQRFAFALGAVSLVGQAASIVAATRVVGPIYGYLVTWEAALPVVAAMGLGIALLGDGPTELAQHPARSLLASARTRDGVTLVLAAGALAVGVILGVKAERLPPVSSLSVADVGQAWRLLGPQLRASDKSVFVDIRSHDSWPLAAGLADQLSLRGVHLDVPQDWVSLFGTSAATGHEPAVVALYQRGESPSSPPPGSRLLGTAGDTVVYLLERPPGTH